MDGCKRWLLTTIGLPQESKVDVDDGKKERSLFPLITSFEWIVEFLLAKVFIVVGFGKGIDQTIR